MRKRSLTIPRVPLIGLLGGIAMAGVLIGFWARAYRLASPGKAVFDEVYFPVFAAQFLRGQVAFDVHPPLGKYLIATGIWLFGDSPFGWRIVPLLFGVAGIAVFARLGFRLRGWVMALLLALFVSIEPFFVLYSRVGLMDGVLCISIMAVFLGALSVRTNREAFFLALCIGLLVAVKWIALGVLVPIAFVLWRRQRLQPFLLGLPLAALAYYLICVSAQMIGGVANPWMEAWRWQDQAFGYHLDLTATHPWGSPWWTWPLLLRPLLMFYEGSGSNVQVMTAIGNPLLWYAATLSVVAGSIYLVWGGLRRRLRFLDHPLLPLLLGYYTFFLPWAFVHRVVFIYHYLPAYAFALLVLGYLVTALWQRYSLSVVSIAVLVLVVSVIYLPLATAQPVSERALGARLLLKDDSSGLVDCSRLVPKPRPWTCSWL